MQPISVRTTSNKFIVSIDRKWVDGEAFAYFIEKLRLKVLLKEDNSNKNLEQSKPEEQRQTARYVAAQRFKSSATPASITSKYDVYEQ